MKKIAIFSILALAATLTGCDNYDLPNPPGQTNPDLPVFEAQNFSVTPLVSETETVDLANLDESISFIPLASYSVAGYPADYDVECTIEMASSADFNNTYELTTVYENVESVASGNGVVDLSAQIGVAPTDLQIAFNKVVSLAPSAKAVYVRVVPYAVNGDTRYYIGSEKTVYGPYSFNVLPQPQDYFIAQDYYLLGTINGWDTSTALKMTHSDADVYEDPVFKITFEITDQQAADGWWWKIVTADVVANGWPASPATDTVVGPAENGDTSLSGSLVSSDAQAGCVKEAGVYTLTINMETLTYEFVGGSPYLYTPGNSNGWSHDNCQRLTTNDYVNYYGYCYLDGEFKFTNAADWSHTNYGNAGEDGKLSTDGGAGNLNAPAAGLYYATVNIEKLTYTITPVTRIGVVGDATPNGWNSPDTELQKADDKGLIWKGQVNFTTGEWKIRANDGWDINLGGSMDNLVPNGSNIPSTWTDTKTVTLYLDTLPYIVDVN